MTEAIMVKQQSGQEFLHCAGRR